MHLNNQKNIRIIFFRHGGRATTVHPEGRPMQIHIIAVGKIKEKFLQDGIAEYTKRLRPYVKLNILEVAEEKEGWASHPADQQRIMDAGGNTDSWGDPTGIVFGYRP